MMLRPRCCWTLKLSVTTRCPFMKTPNEPESTVCTAGCLALSLSLSLSLSSCFWSRAWAARVHRNTIAISHRASLVHFNVLLLGNSSNSLSPVQIKGSGDLGGNGCRIFATGFHAQRCFQVTRPASIVEPLEALGIYEQGTIDLLAASLLLAAPPQFGNGSVQKDRGNSEALDSRSVFLLHKCTASKGDDHRRPTL